MSAATADQWATYSSHRRRVMLAIDVARREAQSVRSSPRLCILGAGNLNDVDLRKLSREFTEIHLVDIDRGAVEAALERQSRGRAEFASISIHAPVDLSGASENVHLRRSLPGSLPLIARRLAAHPASLNSIRARFGERFDVVASTCVLSQLMRQTNEAFPADEPVRRNLARVVRDAHVQTMLSLLAPGGVGVLVTEFSGSSIAEADFARMGEFSDLAAEAQRLVSEGKYFAWLAPSELKDHALSERYAGRVWRAQLTGPWLWTFLGKRYLCSALLVQCALRPAVNRELEIEEERCVTAL